MFEAICKEPLNRCIMKTNFSWISMLYDHIYRKYVYDMSYTTSNKKALIKPLDKDKMNEEEKNL